MSETSRLDAVLFHIKNTREDNEFLSSSWLGCYQYVFQKIINSC